MPSITFSYKDLCNLVGQKLEIDKIAELLSYGKGELENYDKETDEITASMGDTNLPYLWSVEGIARLIRGLIGKQKGIPTIDITKKPQNKMIIDSSVSPTRPFISAFAAKGKKVDDYIIKQMIDLQEKFCSGYGRKRKKVAIGVYNLKKINFPITYKATDPESVKFIPLEFKKEMTQQEILEDHPTGKEYAWILEGAKQYPLLVDADNNVLSFPPIINSNYSGKIEIGDENLFFEATGDDLDAVLLAANIFAQAFHERGFLIESVDAHYPSSYETDKITTPFLFNESVRISLSQVKELLGLELSEEEVKNLLEKMQYEYKNGIVKIPDYRRDILHPVDVIEDIGIAYGYHNIENLHMKSYTKGNTFDIIRFVDNVRELLIGLGYQEIMSAMLSSKTLMLEKMNSSEDIIEIKEFISENYSTLRNWLMPILMDVLSKNKSSEYPQLIFEEGLVTLKQKDSAKDFHKLAAVIANVDADYTKARQAFDLILRSFSITYKITAFDHPSFIQGRAGKIIVKDKEIGIIGEIHPQVLTNFDLTVPVAGFEINLTELLEVIK